MKLREAPVCKDIHGTRQLAMALIVKRWFACSTIESGIMLWGYEIFHKKLTSDFILALWHTCLYTCRVRLIGHQRGQRAVQGDQLTASMSATLLLRLDQNIPQLFILTQNGVEVLSGFCEAMLSWIVCSESWLHGESAAHQFSVPNCKQSKFRAESCCWTALFPSTYKARQHQNIDSLTAGDRLSQKGFASGRGNLSWVSQQVQGE